MDIKLIRDEMQRLDQISGLDTSKIPVRISSRMTRGWGKCTYTYCNKTYSVKELVFANRLMEYATVEHILNVVRHEYAHAYVTLKHNKNIGHGDIWKQAALRFGCNGKRCENFSEVDQTTLSKYKYQIVCQNCGKTYLYQRKSNVVKELARDPNSSHYRCGKCKKDKFVLNVVSVA